MTRTIAVCLTALSMFAAAPVVQAQTIYPLTRAEILAGSKFDFKVEFPASPAEADVTVTINGQPPGVVLGGQPRYSANEDGMDHGALWIKGASIPTPGVYTVQATAAGKTAEVRWEVFGTPARRAKNVILFIGDGMSVAHRTAARIMSKGIVEGRYGGELAIDDMPHMALVSTSGTDSVVTDSANAMTAYTTGHKSCVNALGVYCARNKASLDHPKVETIAELVKRKNGMAVGVVTNTEIEDATPAGMVAHTRRRADFNDIVKMFLDAAPEVMMGGGSPNFLPKSTNGSKRTDGEDYIAKFTAAGYRFVSTATDMKSAAAEPGAAKLLGLFNTENIDGALDRLVLKKGSVGRFPDQPELADQVRVAIELLTKSPNGFVLMVESGRIDKYTHTMDPERAIFDTIMLDEAVKVAKAFAEKANDTLVIVVPDHAHSVAIVGTQDDDLPGQTPREKLGIYEKSAFPRYPRAEGSAYPSSVDVPRRIAFAFGSYPDHCENGKPYLDDPNVPAVAGEAKGTFIANEKYCDRPGAVRITGNLPASAPQAVHAADDVVLTAMGPGAELFRGRIDNTRVFRVMATALGLAPP